MALSAARLKRLRSLRTSKGRREEGCFLIEGEKLVGEALAAGAPVLELFAVESQVPELTALAGSGPDAPPVTPVSAKDSERISDTRTPQGCFAVLRDAVPAAAAAIAELPPDGPSTVVALDCVQDPGNAGALIRVAAAFGVDLVLAGPGTADPAQPKVLRAATGAWFQIVVARSSDLAGDLATLTERGFSALGATPSGVSVWEAAAAERRVLVLGSEGGGFSEAVEGAIGERVGVPIAEGVESLNVAVAAGIVLGAWSRGRGLRGEGFGGAARSLPSTR